MIAIPLDAVLWITPHTHTQQERIEAMQLAAWQAAQERSFLSLAITIRDHCQGFSCDSLSAILQITRLWKVVPDPPGRESLAGPLWTLANGVGDCLGLSGCLLAILYACGIKARLQILATDCEEDHVFCVASVGGWAVALDPTVQPPTVGAVARCVPPGVPLQNGVG